VVSPYPSPSTSTPNSVKVCSTPSSCRRANSPKPVAMWVAHPASTSWTVALVTPEMSHPTTVSCSFWPPKAMALVAVARLPEWQIAAYPPSTLLVADSDKRSRLDLTSIAWLKSVVPSSTIFESLPRKVASWSLLPLSLAS
jgi:hypothetical protein